VMVQQRLVSRRNVLAGPILVGGDGITRRIVWTTILQVNRCAAVLVVAVNTHPSLCVRTCWLRSFPYMYTHRDRKQAPCQLWCQGRSKNRQATTKTSLTIGFLLV